jgi:hypothetical protein
LPVQPISIVPPRTALTIAASLPSYRWRKLDLGPPPVRRLTSSAMQTAVLWTVSLSGVARQLQHPGRRPGECREKRRGDRSAQRAPAGVDFRKYTAFWHFDSGGHRRTHLAVCLGESPGAHKILTRMQQ